MAADADAERRAGFSLFEVLVALVIAALLIQVLTRAFSTALIGTRVPMETVSAMSVARAVAADMRAGARTAAVTTDGAIGAYRYAVTVEPLPISPLPSRLPPPIPEANPPGGGAPTAAASAGAARPPAGASGAASGNSPQDASAAKPRRLERIGIIVTAPSGRRIHFESVRLEQPAR